MKITVLGGSPKGETSVTMQYVKFIQRAMPEHEFRIIQVAQPIKKLESDEGAFNKVLDEVRSSDGVLWAFPLYYCLVCSQYKRFIELIWERGGAASFAGKYAASLSTSIHFFDNTAHNYMHAISDDLCMRYVGCYPAHMQELLKEEGQERIRFFAANFLSAIESGMETGRRYSPITWKPRPYTLTDEPEPRISTDKRVVVVTDSEDADVGEMIRRFTCNFVEPVDVVNLRTVDIKGGCMGCIQCGPDNVCAYTGRDEYIAMFNGRIKPADIIVIAGTVTDRYLSSRWKMFFDRSFFNTHQPVLQGKQFGFLISGPLSQVSDLREILTAYVEMQRSNPVAFISDEQGDPKQLGHAIDGLAAQLHRCAEQGYVRAQSFLGVGGMKIFRDDVWGGLRVVFKGDHRYYKNAGYYDFPQRKFFRNLFIRIAYAVTGLSFIKKKMMGNMKKFMLTPYRKVLEAR
jgi:multimeric flavodoxin WrbA